VDDWPRWIDAGSAVNCVICGAAGGGGVAAAGAGGGGGGGGGGTFFLQPAPTSAKASAIAMTINFHLLNMNIFS
jgi:hypothetical protein